MKDSAMRLINLLVEKKRLAFFVVSLVLVIGMHWMALSQKIRAVEPAAYRSRAVDLKVTPKYRYGYCWSWHGAVLIKTVNVEGASPEVLDGEHPFDFYPDKRSPDECLAHNGRAPGLSPDEQRAFLQESSVDVIMKDELSLVPLKFTLELALYIVMLMYAFFGVRWMRHRLHDDRSRNFDQCTFTALAWMVFWILVFLPLGLYRYGYPVYSTWEGPGALISSTIPFKMSSGSGLTVSYRHVIEFFSMYPLMFLDLVYKGLRHVPVIGGSIDFGLATMGTLFYGLGGVLYILRRNRTLIWGILVRVCIVIACLFFVVVGPFPPWRQPQWVRELVNSVIFTLMKIVFPWL